MIYHVHTDTDPTPRQIYASSSKWAARKWARLYHEGSYKTTVHVRQPGGLSTSWTVWPETMLVYRVMVAASA